MQNAPPKLSRPHWARWLFAALSAWLSAPLFAPFMWRFLMIEGIDLPAFLAVGFWTYFIGLPIAGIGVVLLLVVTFIGFPWLAAWIWWKWAIAGASTGLAIISIIMRPDIEGFPKNEAGILLYANGPVSGLVAALVFRWVLLAKR